MGRGRQKCEIPETSENGWEPGVGWKGTSIKKAPESRRSERSADSGNPVIERLAAEERVNLKSNSRHSQEGGGQTRGGRAQAEKRMPKSGISSNRISESQELGFGSKAIQTPRDQKTGGGEMRLSQSLGEKRFEKRWRQDLEMEERVVN